MRAGLEIVDTGPLATVQDLGRPGYADVGVSTSGAADRASFRLANRLAGNEEGLAAVEITFGGFTARALHDTTVAITGAPCPITVDERSGAMNSVLRLPAGAVLRLGTPHTGLRTYLAAHGGFDVEPVLGSRSTDLLSGLGPPPLRRNDVLPVGRTAGLWSPVGIAPVAPPPADELTVRITPGPRADFFTEDALRTLVSEPYAVTSESNRIGIRLSGKVLSRTRCEEMPSEGIVLGSLQVPPSGQPTLFLADHPVTGGYPVIGVVLSTDVDRAAQARPGMVIHFAMN
ncbi:biotin-dependent carboxyltransferase family protein [Amycolatopsis acidicola]|uniref:Biotin-dependent carboxyltransferase family protein n=1 Tax=Amycolatopsis acidicola TaxID=2596893 RepID=A0A5N0VMT7_9PSEU|nr:biotin-dependent carboxyltransferase family protein [Amycolatopsis acidicola]KAA9166883.1 biotin-dependent carboxyltransferase family protein [Amycolatopsis acidicola]